MITVTVYFVMSHMQSHTSSQSTHPTPHMALQTPPLRSSPPSSESQEMERAGGYQFTVTHMPNSFAFGGGNVPTSFQ